MSKKITNRKVVLISATVMVVVLILGFTLALWSRNFTQTGINTIASDCFNIEYSESDATSLVNAYPQTDEDGLKNVSYDVTIENTCNTVTNYSVVLNELSTNTLSESHVKVAVNDSYKMLNTYDEATPSSEVENASSARLLTQGVLGPEQEKTISIKSWMDENTSEAEGENKTFSYKITIEANAGANDLLASKIFTNAITHTIAPTKEEFKYGEPTAAAGINGYTYSYTTEPNKSYTIQLNSNSNRALGTDFTFDKTTGYFTLTGITTDMSFTSESIGKYACATGFDGTTFNNTGINCTVVYKINNVNESGETKYITRADVYQTNGTNSGSGIFITSDEDGLSYYYRGEVNNNYVRFANKLWRIIRINGNGSIRIILNQGAGNPSFNSMYQGHKYVGYTYDNMDMCTKANPCVSTYNGSAIFTNNDVIGSASPENHNSTIKTYLENWYHTNIGNIYNAYVEQGSFCNDTSHTVSGSYYIYGSSSRMTNSTPNLDCANTNETYGGYYKSQIGLITADELMLAGYGYSKNTTINNFLYSNTLKLLSPLSSQSIDACLLSGKNGIIYSYEARVTRDSQVRPVINLVANIKVSSGNGTQSTPYVISMN